MAEPLFIAVVPFDPSDGDRWLEYYQWAKIPQLTGVISLDALLCQRVVREIRDEDWNHIVNADFRLHYFHDLAYLLRRTEDAPRKLVLGVYRNPNSHITLPPADNFTFVGYDLIEETTQISALTNCGGFPDCFSNAELNKHGLIDTFERAQDVRQLLVKLHPEEPHFTRYGNWTLNVLRPVIVDSIRIFFLPLFRNHCIYELDVRYLLPFWQN